MTLRADLSDVQVQAIVDGIPSAPGDVEKWCVVALWEVVWPGWPDSMPLHLDDATISRASRERVRDALRAHVADRPDCQHLLALFDGSAPKAHEDVVDPADDVTGAN